MPPVIEIGDQNQLVPTKEYPKYAHFPFENFNPIQSSIFEHYNKDANFIIAASTSAGKTCIAEMLIAHEVRERGGKAMYLAPLRALAKEKIDDWTEKAHHFGDLNLSVCTGDFRLTPARKKELDESNIVLMTNEMLAARCRNYGSENNQFLQQIKTLVIDEAHLLGTPSRGHHTEVALMKFCKINPECRIVALSATLPNVQEVSEWVSYSLTGRNTFLLKSKYRPCPLGVNYELYYDKGSYGQVEAEKINAALNIRNEYKEDKFLIFAHTKTTGNLMAKALEEHGFPCQFHSADLPRDKRHKLEKDFKDGKLQTVVATSTLAWGVNLPARRVIILGVHRGMDEVDDYDILQMIGRSGRPGYDPRGDAYILVPQSKDQYYIDRLQKPEAIRSRLLDYIGNEEEPHYKNLAFHLVSEINQGEVSTKDEIHKWYETSLGYFQSNDLADDIVERTLDMLLKCGAIWKQDDKYAVTMVGKIASLFYYSPFDVADLKKNFQTIFDNNLQANDLMVSMGLGNTDTTRMGIVSNAERGDMESYASKIRMFPKKYMETAIKGGYIYYLLMNGHNPGYFASQCRNHQLDFERLNMVLNALDSMSCKWDKKDWLTELNIRVNYGVKKELVQLCRLPNVGKARAEKLASAGIKTPALVLQYAEKANQILKFKPDAFKEVIKEAKKLVFTT